MEERLPEVKFSNCNRLHKLLVCGNVEEVLSETGNICYQIERKKITQVLEEIMKRKGELDRNLLDSSCTMDTLGPCVTMVSILNPLINCLYCLKVCK